MTALEHDTFAPKDDGLFVASLAKGFRVLESFHGRRRRLTLKEIAELAQIGMSATQRAVSTLTTLGYLAKDEQTRTYRLTPKTLALCWEYLSNSDLHDVALPIIRGLAERFGETVNLSERLNNELVVVGRAPGRHAVPVNVGIGTRYPLVSTAPGLAILAYSDPTATKEFIDTTTIIPWTKHTITSKAEVLAEIDRIRVNGFAVGSQLMHDGHVSIAAPILDSFSGSAIAAINLSAYLERWTQIDVMSTLVPAVREAANSISAMLRH
ncbi:IclR family transcriptional regulator [Devosia ginsengisoli]|uniref:Helix-turn-helix domain-containing protein n=1 Tax=Devosia ginsengisoli TaxID=400770 RepID=A0A5B8LYW1_9HYPH|nr:IclR family transcriptional regulator C-terminal domain-containing protein [Devosia ginsengisoli]QDZ12715.1 helix-turn-helix domain-containing protein [Devosia ginsengisoli]